MRNLCTKEAKEKSKEEKEISLLIAIEGAGPNGSAPFVCKIVS